MRLFVAARPPAEVLDGLERLPRAAAAHVRWTTRDQWHVTLRFLGNVEDPGPVIRAVRDAVRDMGVCTATIGPAPIRLGRDVVALPVRGLDELASAVIGSTADMGHRAGARPFRGHLTLARTKGGRVDLHALDLDDAWTVDTVEVIRSHLGANGARYETLERCAL